MRGAVSRETPPAPPAAQGVFGSGLVAAEAYAQWLAHAGIDRGLLGPREVPRLWDRHLLNCAVVGEHVPPGATVCDVGSGAGLPGIPLAICRPDLRVTLVEPLLRRALFLEEVVGALELAQVTVRRARAEDLTTTRAGRRWIDPELGAGFDVVTARAVAPLAKLAGWTLPLARAGGLVLAMKGSAAPAELAAAAAALRRFGGGQAEIVLAGGGVVDPPVQVVRVVKDEARGE